MSNRNLNFRCQLNMFFLRKGVLNRPQKFIHVAFVFPGCSGSFWRGPGRKGRAQTEQESELSGAEQKAHPMNHVSLEMANYDKHPQKHWIYNLDVEGTVGIGKGTCLCSGDYGKRKQKIWRTNGAWDWSMEISNKILGQSLWWNVFFDARLDRSW